MEMLSLRAQIQESDLDRSPDGSVSVRVVPFGESITHHGREVHFLQGGIRMEKDLVPVNLEHEDSATTRIGKATQVAESTDGLYASLKISQTALGHDTLTLLRDGVLTDVSAGVLLDGDFQDGALTGVLDHIAITAKGAFGQAEKPSKVMAVHSAHMEGESVSETNEAPEVGPEMTELSQEVAELKTVLAELSVPGNIKEPEPVAAFTDMKDWLLTMAKAAKGDGEAAARFALAGDTTTGAAGLVPDWQTFDVISVIDTSRPYISSLPTDPIGDYGMSLDYPRVTQKPDVDLQAGENQEVASQSMTVDTVSFGIDTYAGANLASKQVVERSAPSYVSQFFAEMAGVYSQKTEAAAIAAGVAGAGGTAILADLGASASATYAAFVAAAGAISGGVRRPASDVVLATDRWTQLMGLVDTDGRPLVVFPENGPQNAQGQGPMSGLGANAAQYAGLTVHHAPDAAAGTCLIYAADRFHWIAEQRPQELRAEVVSTLSWELGVYGYFVPDIVKYPVGGYTLTVA